MLPQIGAGAPSDVLRDGDAYAARSAPESSRRSARGGKRRRGEAPPEEELQLCARGIPCTLHESGDSGSGDGGGCVALEALLHGWSGDRCVTIDRYDVRNLLPEWAPPAAGRGWCACCEAAEAEECGGGAAAAVLASERFGDLWAAAEEEAAQAGMCARAARRLAARTEPSFMDGCRGGAVRVLCACVAPRRAAAQC
jgi:hypothetical protein